MDTIGILIQAASPGAHRDAIMLQLPPGKRKGYLPSSEEAIQTDKERRLSFLKIAKEILGDRVRLETSRKSC